MIEVFKDVDRVEHREEFGSNLKRILQAYFKVAFSKLRQKPYVSLMAIKKNQNHRKSNTDQGLHHSLKMLKQVRPVKCDCWHKAH